MDFAVRAGSDLAQTVLAIQGPPGAGKTFTGAQMICALVAQGKRVGVIATGHSVIRTLLDAIAKAAAKLGRNDVTLGHKVDEAEADEGSVLEISDNQAAFEALQSGEIKVLGGTAWLWSRPEFAKSVDVLFVDEAGQMSLANVLAVTQAAHSIVLLGDPQQLEQPKKGTHPEGVGLSALQHMLGSHVTIPTGRGIFLPETWRLSRTIAAFTSEVFYEGRLRAKPGLERQQLVGSAFAGGALWAVDVKHEGNRNASDEEVEAVDQLVTALLKSGSRWVDELGSEAQITSRDILYQPSDWLTDDCPVAACDGHDFPRLIDQHVPGVAAVIDDIVEGFEDAIGQPVLSHELPDVFLGVELRRTRRQRQER